MTMTTIESIEIIRRDRDGDEESSNPSTSSKSIITGSLLKLRMCRLHLLMGENSWIEPECGEGCADRANKRTDVTVVQVIFTAGWEN